MPRRLSLSSSLADLAETRLHHPESGIDSWRQVIGSPWSAGTMLSRVSKRGVSSLTTALKNNALIDIHPEVMEGLSARKPVVALESTIITHGMPYPVNLETARSVERNVRMSGSIPATIGLIDGRVKIGLESHELERLAERRNEPVKLSRRDIGAAIALKRDGGTTCSATLIFAALTGIKVRSTPTKHVGSDTP